MERRFLAPTLALVAGLATFPSNAWAQQPARNAPGAGVAVDRACAIAAAPPMRQVLANGTSSYLVVLRVSCAGENVRTVYFVTPDPGKLVLPAPRRPLPSPSTQRGPDLTGYSPRALAATESTLGTRNGLVR